MSAPRARRQHTAAKVYLRGFADDTGQLCRHGRDGHVEIRNIRSASVERDFYTYQNASGQPDERVEHWFGTDVEDAAAATLRSLQRGEDLRPEWISTLARFVASSLLRTARVRSYMEQIDTTLRPMLVLQQAAARTETNLAVLTDAQIQALLEAAADAVSRVPVDAEEARRSQLRTMLRKIDEVTDQISRWNWEHTPSEEQELITGDAPVVALDPAPGPGWHGLLPPHCTLATPITPSSVLLASAQPMLGAGVVSATMAAQIRAGLVSNCHRAVFHHPSTPHRHDLHVPEHAPTLPDPTVTWRPATGDAPTFPARYPPVSDATVQAVIEHLGGTDLVE